MESIVLSTKLGWKMGFEPTTPGTTIQCSNQLSYNHHMCSDLFVKSTAKIERLSYMAKSLHACPHKVPPPQSLLG